MVSKSAMFDAAVNGLLEMESFESIARAATQPLSDLSAVLWTGPPQVFMLEEVPDEVLREALNDARSNARSFDGLNRALALRLQSTSYPLTEEMRIWIAGVLFGTNVRPPSSGGNDGLAGATKRIMVALLVHHARQFGLKATRSEASPPHSACDAVVAALRHFGHHTTYDAVAKSWTTHAQAYMRE